MDMEAQTRLAAAATLKGVSAVVKEKYGLSFDQMDEIWAYMVDKDASVKNLSDRDISWEDLNAIQADKLLRRYSQLRKKEKSQQKGAEVPTRDASLSEREIRQKTSKARQTLKPSKLKSAQTKDAAKEHSQTAALNKRSSSPDIKTYVSEAEEMEDAFLRSISAIQGDCASLDGTKKKKRPLPGKVDLKSQDIEETVLNQYEEDPASEAHPVLTKQNVSSRQLGKGIRKALRSADRSALKFHGTVVSCIDKLRRVQDEAVARISEDERMAFAARYIKKREEVQTKIRHRYKEMHSCVIRTDGTIDESWLDAEDARAEAAIVRSLAQGRPLTGKLTGIEKVGGRTAGVVFLHSHKILIPFSELLEVQVGMNKNALKAEEFYLSQRLGSDVDFVVKSYDPDHLLAGASRREAMEVLCDAMYFAKDSEGGYRIRSGMHTDARIVSVSKSGLIVEKFGAECFIEAEAFGPEGTIPYNCRPGGVLRCVIASITRNRKRRTVSIEMQPVLSVDHASLQNGERYLGEVEKIDVEGVLVRCSGAAVYCRENRIQKWIAEQSETFAKENPEIHARMMNEHEPWNKECMDAALSLLPAFPMKEGEQVTVKIEGKQADGLYTGALVRTKKGADV